ncbi:MAG: SPOR domain-containing protein [Pseudomonadota bacterium]
MQVNTELSRIWRNTAKVMLFGGAAFVLAACEEGQGPSFDFFQTEPSTETRNAVATTTNADGVVEQDVEAPEIFSVNENGLWDGRPSLGGTWVAYPDVKDPQRVIIRNADNGKSITGALFRRERLNPGPKLQVSSDAAEALGMLAGQPAKLSVVALKKEKIAPPPAAAPIDGAGAAEAAEVEAATAGIEAKPLDPVDVASSAIERAAPTQRPAAAAAPAAATPAAAPAATAPRDTSSLPNPFIQVGTFSNKSNADAAADRLRQAGIIPTTKTSTGSSGTLYRVLVGPASDIEERKVLLTQVQGLGFDDVYFANN